MPIYTYSGQFYIHLYNNFSFEIEANSKEDANAKSEEYFKNEMNHESIIRNSEQDSTKCRMNDLKLYFKENAQVDSAFREDETFDVWMSMED
jgi:hypothetical protein